MLTLMIVAAFVAISCGAAAGLIASAHNSADEGKAMADDIIGLDVTV